MKLTAEHISKTIKNKVILDDIDLSLDSGNVYGFVGRNGCGKTMLFRALSGLMHIDSGKITVDDKTLHKDMNILESLGLIIENAGLFNEFTGFMNLKILADIKDSYNELVYKVSWPTQKELANSAVVVMFASLIIAAVVFAMDFCLENVMQLIYGLF